MHRAPPPGLASPRPPHRPPPLPGIRLEMVEDNTAKSRCDEGYLQVRRRKYVAKYPGNPRASSPFAYDIVERWLQDAVAVLLHFEVGGTETVLLRSSVRPALGLRTEPLVVGAASLPDGAEHGELWEIPAGLVETDERTPDGLVRCVVRETQEEIGLHIRAEDVQPLGGPLLPTAGVIAECVYLYEVRLSDRTELQRAGFLQELEGGEASSGVPYTVHDGPSGDGPLEAGARILAVPLSLALAWCDDGLLPDVKTEISLRRLAARLGSSQPAPPGRR